MILVGELSARGAGRPLISRGRRGGIGRHVTMGQYLFSQHLKRPRPPTIVLDCGRLWWPWSGGNGGERRLDTRVGLGGEGSVAYAQPGYARAAGAQSSGRVCPLEPSPHPRRPRDRAVQICESAARARGQPRSID